MEHKNYEDENHQFSTILKIVDGGVWLENNLWGMFFTKRFDGSIDWDGWRTKHKPGDVIPVLRQERGDTYAYMTGFDLHTREEKLRDFIDQKEQDAVVTGCMQFQPTGFNENRTHVECWSPVWKQIEFDTPRIDVRRGDRLTLTRKQRANTSQYDYYIKENHSVKQIIQNVGINEILNDFNKADRNRLLILADQIRLGLEK